MSWPRAGGCVRSTQVPSRKQGSAGGRCGPECAPFKQGLVYKPGVGNLRPAGHVRLIWSGPAEAPGVS